jgi:hypothetical protein
MPNPTLDQTVGNITLLKNGNSSVTERMSRSFWNSDLLDNVSFHNPRLTVSMDFSFCYGFGFVLCSFLRVKRRKTHRGSK